MTADKAELVLHEGLIAGHPNSDSVAVTRGRIVAHGAFNELKGLVGPRTHLLKLGGRAVVPGFIDSHIHFFEAAAAATGVSVARCRTIGDLLADLRLAAGKAPPGNWLRAFGCDEALMAERRGPTRDELEQAVPKNPLRLRHQTLHASWLNRRAISQLGIDQPGFQAPNGAIIVRDAGGRLTGFVVGMEEWITRKLPLVTKAETESRARIMSRELASAGVTSFTDATVRNAATELELFDQLAASGAIAQRVSVMLGAEQFEAAIASPRDGSAGPRAAVAAVKFMTGASFDVRRAAQFAALARDHGLACAFHATEVEELEQALAVIEAASAREASAAERPAWRIEHGGLIPPNFISRIALAGAWVVTNPGFIHFRGAKYADEPGLAPHLYPARSLKRAGISLAGATDAPVTPSRPLVAIAAAASRQTSDGFELAPDEKLSLDDALAMFTSDAARLARLDAGAIEPGLAADVVVLPRDPLAVSPAELLGMPVDITIIGGKIVYERGRPAFAHSDTAELLTS
jgi:hypothetical protein